MAASAEFARKRKRTGSITMPKLEEPDANLEPADGHTLGNVNSDAPLTEKERVHQLESHTSALHKNNAKLSQDLATAVRKHAELHERYTKAVGDHANLVKSHAKRVDEKNSLIKKNADLFQENADLRAENATHIEDIVARDNRIIQLEEENNALMNAREQDAIEVGRLLKERDDLQRQLDRIFPDMNKGAHEVEWTRERGRSRRRFEWEAREVRDRGRSREADRPSFRDRELPIGADRNESGRKRTLSTYRDDQTTERERSEQRARSRSRKGFPSNQALVLDRHQERDRDQLSSRHYTSEWENRRDEDGVLRMGRGESYHPISAPLPRQNRARSPYSRQDNVSRPSKAWVPTANGKTLPTGPNKSKSKSKFKSKAKV